MIRILALAAAALAFGIEAQALQGGSVPAAVARHVDEVEGARLVDAGKHQEGLRALERAVAAYRRSGDRLGVARGKLKMSAACRALAQLDPALRHAEDALAAARGDAALRLAALTQLGRVASDRGELDRADGWLRQALPLAERAGDALAESNVRRALGRIADGRGLQAEALQHLQASIRAADRAGDLAARVSSRANASVSLLGLSRFDDALANAQEAFEISRNAKPAAVRAEALFTLAQTHSHLWNLDRSAELWPQTAEAYREANNARGIALTTKQSVDTSFARGDFDRAIADGEKAVELLHAVGLQQFVAETMARLALSETRRGRMDAARAWSSRARAEIHNAPLARHPFVYNDLGLAAIELNQLDAAAADFARVGDAARAIGNVEYDWRAEWGLGRTMIARGDFGGARAALEHAIAIVERLRQTIPEAGLRATFMINRVGPYDTLVEATMGRSTAPGDEPARAALSVAERARSRALADLLAEARSRMSDPRLQAVRDQEIEFGRRFSSAARRAAATTAADRGAALEELRTLEHEYDALVVRIRRDNAGYAALAHPRALGASGIASLLRPDEALIEFLITERRGFAWIVRRDAVASYEVPAQTELATETRFLQALLAADDRRAVERVGAQLYDRLIKPAEPALGGARRLIIVPDGALQRLPFALLRDGHRWLVERFALTLAPSATVLDVLRQAPVGRAPHPLLALAAPDATAGQTAVFDMPGSFGTLAHAAKEIAAAATLVGDGQGQVHSGPDATEAVLKSPDAKGYRLIHLAAHAAVDEIVPRRSAVLLSPSGSDDGLLQVSEIANLSLSADLVVLAACRSNVGRLVRGEGLLSISRAFMHAGARAILATSWRVDDRATAWLMQEFYRALSDGLSPDEALQRAQRRAIASRGPAAAPSTWAAFLVVGDAGTPIAAPQARAQTRLAVAAGLLLMSIVIVALAMRRKSLRRA